MQEALIPANDSDRIADLLHMHILSTPAEHDFDRITRLASEYFDTPISLFTLVDQDRQWFKSRIGLDVGETPRNVSFCGHVITQDEVFVVEDASLDSRFSDNPLVAGEPKVVFYAGVPISSSSGHRIGTLCVIDHSPRSFSQREKERLRDFAWWLQLALDRRTLSRTQLELITELDAAKREALIDPLTQSWNRKGFAELATREIARCRRTGRSVAILMIDIDHFKQINDSHGHPAGDKAIIWLARLLRSATRPNDIVARLGGEEFGIMLPEIEKSDALLLAESLRRLVEEKSGFDNCQRFTVSIGVNWIEKLEAGDSDVALIAVADAALYDAKNAGRNQVRQA